MKRTLLALVPWMALAASAPGQVRMAEVLFTHHADTPTRAFRVGDECFVPLDSLSEWGWEATLDGDTVQVKAEGSDLKIPMRVFSGKQTIPLRTTVEKLGGKASWDLGADTLHVFSELSTLSLAKTKFSAAAPLSFQPKASLLTNPGRVVIDLEGVRLGSVTRQSLDGNARATQFRPDVVRVVIETDLVPELDKISKEGTRQLDFDLDKVEVPKVVVPPKQNDFPTTVPPITDTVPRPTGAPIEVQFENNERVSIRLPLSDTLNGDTIIGSPDPTTLTVRLPGMAVALPAGFRLSSDILLSTTSAVDPEGTTLTLQFARPVGVEAVTQGSTMLITLLKPNTGTSGTPGSLQGKVIVVDPGHGGFDPGSQAGGVREKDINLKMGLLIAAGLEAEGATVILTRSTDVFVTLDRRAIIANKNKADFFISTHVNSTGKAAAQSGTITFHHKGKEISRVLAACIHSEITKVNKLPNIGVWSDGRIYNSGFSVLRQTKMPGVLLELGFVNHPKDRARMVTDDFQRSVAAAVVRGLKVFLGDAQKK